MIVHETGKLYAHGSLWYISSASPATWVDQLFGKIDIHFYILKELIVLFIKGIYHIMFYSARTVKPYPLLCNLSVKFI